MTSTRRHTPVCYTDRKGPWRVVRFTSPPAPSSKAGYTVGLAIAGGLGKIVFKSIRRIRTPYGEEQGDRGVKIYDKSTPRGLFAAASVSGFGGCALHSIRARTGSSAHLLVISFPAFRHAFSRSFRWLRFFRCPCLCRKTNNTFSV